MYFETAGLTVTDLRQYLWCPRIPFYRLCWGFKPPPTSSMARGQQRAARVETLERRRSLAKYGLEQAALQRQLSLYSAALDLKGIVDMVLATEHESVPVEIKTGSADTERFHVQLAAYGWLLRENGRKCTRGFIYSLDDDDVTEIPFTPALDARVKEIVTHLQQIALGDLLPPGTDRHLRCPACEYRRACSDR